jgi:hypothetical protein
VLGDVLSKGIEFLFERISNPVLHVAQLGASQGDVALQTRKLVGEELSQLPHFSQRLASYLEGSNESYEKKFAEFFFSKKSREIFLNLFTTEIQS